MAGGHVTHLRCVGFAIARRDALSCDLQPELPQSLRYHTRRSPRPGGRRSRNDRASLDRRSQTTTDPKGASPMVPLNRDLKTSPRGQIHFHKEIARPFFPSSTRFYGCSLNCTLRFPAMKPRLMMPAIIANALGSGTMVRMPASSGAACPW